MRRILVIRLSAIGDVILTSAPLLNLKLSFPDSLITLLTRENLSGLKDFMAGVDRFIFFPEKGSPTRLFQLAEQLDQSGFDTIIDMHGNFRSWYLLRHISASAKISYRKRRWERLRATMKGNLKKIISTPPHTIDLYNEAVTAAGGIIFSERPILRIPRNDTTRLSFDSHNPIVAIAPGASFPTKQWPAERFRRTALALQEQFEANIILILGENDSDFKMPDNNGMKGTFRVIKNEPLDSLARIIAACDLIICNDSALAHLGSAVGTPVLAIFGPTHPTLGFSPRGLFDRVLQVAEPCRPCSLHGRKPCYRDEPYCFTRITVDDLLSQAGEMLQSRAAHGKALFIDRDGTLIKEKDFLSDPGQVEPEDGAVEAVRTARSAGYKIIVLSNQSGVARGLFSEAIVSEINRRVRDIFTAAGAPLDDIYYCPHHPDGAIAAYAISCRCRKPLPGMVEEAARKHDINPHISFTLGDKLADSQLAHVVGARGIMVRTGYGREEEARWRMAGGLGPETVVANLFEAVKYILSRS